ncbi:MAG: ferredoxin-type protein NapG [Nitrospirae bacterium]|nr:ferredoxin-type protein NapG [Nitrospirota bacterium]MBF0533514.1 ferredoxin-type protein NapG [Nitrospirota bacterium]MBF0615962.1 ferredoxin-type protein NapG [Nitrospirota bacterium]
MTGRRKFLERVGIMASAGFLWINHLFEAKAESLILRPPGARPEHEFMSLCIKCGQCVEACPFHTLALADFGSGKPTGTPYFIPRQIPCKMCKDIPCVPACPTGALNAKTVSTPDGKLSINLARMGLAVVDRNTCVAFWGLQCDACYRVCPLIDKAITLDLHRNERTGKHAFIAPIVQSEHCTGCGMCERACINEKASVYVLPRHIALGKPNNRYLRDWKESGEEPQALPTPDASQRKAKDALDYLNRGF